MMIYGLTKERIKEILFKFRDNKDLFNWCEEYKQFINESVLYCVSYEWDYMIKKSYEDGESPISYEDLDLFDLYKAREHIIYTLENEKDENEIKQIFSETNEENNLKIRTIGDYEVYLKNLDKETLTDLFYKLNLDTTEAEGEVYEWWLIRDPLKFRLQEQGEIFLNDAWGRQATGQGISLDYCCITAFINLLKDLEN